MSVTPRVIWQAEAQLGEGPVWLIEEQSLAFVDILNGKLHRYSPETNTHCTIDLGGMPSFVVPTTDGRLFLGRGNALHLLDDDKLGAPLCTLDIPTHNRTNDATVDAQGRLWFGTMDMREREPTGTLYCFDRGTLHEMGGKAIVTNGPAITRDGRTIYHVDSANRSIWRYAIEDGPAIADAQVFIQLDAADGHPDGVVLDSEDCLWVALWDGWGVRRYAPNGTLLLHIDMPCARVTKIAFGGPDLLTAYVTTARVGLSADDLAQQPLAGSLFAFDAPAAGLPLPYMRLSD